MHHLSHPGLRQAVTDYLVEERQHMDLVIDRVTMDSKLRLVREGLAEGNPKPE
jgi:predicted N-acyltransferase